MLDAKAGDVVIIVNPTAYARRIEYGFTGEDSLGRYYNQPGHHMAQQTVAEMPAIAQSSNWHWCSTNSEHACSTYDTRRGAGAIDANESSRVSERCRNCRRLAAPPTTERLRIELCICQSCDWHGSINELEAQLWEVVDLCERIEPGEIVPAGECPKCGDQAHTAVTEYAAFAYREATGKDFDDLPDDDQLRLCAQLRSDATPGEVRAIL
jgi:hypothetical protein